MMRTSRMIGLLAAAALFVGGAANAATVTVDAVGTDDGAILTLNATPDAGETAASYQLTVSVDQGVMSVTGTETMGDFIAAGGENACTSDTRCTAGSAIAFPNPLELPELDATYTVTGLAPGDLVTFDLSELDFGVFTVSDTVSATVIPEPTTAALLGLGFIGLALTGRRR